MTLHLTRSQERLAPHTNNRVIVVRSYLENKIFIYGAKLFRCWKKDVYYFKQKT